MPAFKALLQEPHNFKEFYNFVFTYGKDTRSKGLGADTRQLVLCFTAWLDAGACGPDILVVVVCDRFEHGD